MGPQLRRVWRHAGLAWIALVALPTVIAVMRWYAGPGRDPDMSGVGELVFTVVFFLTLPMGALAFGVFAPLALGIDYVTNGRTTRFVNVLLGAALSVPALLVTLVTAGVVGRNPADAMAVVFHPGRAVPVLTALLLAGMIVGLGLRHRATISPPRT